MNIPRKRKDPAHTPPTPNRKIQKAKEISDRSAAIANLKHQID